MNLQTDISIQTFLIHHRKNEFWALQVTFTQLQLLRPLPLEKSKIKIDVWEDSPKSDLSVTTWFLIWHLVFRHISTIFFLKTMRFPAKMENVFRLFSVYAFLTVFSWILYEPSFYIFNFFYLKEHVNVHRLLEPFS
jgi:hypothetical protein